MNFLEGGQRRIFAYGRPVDMRKSFRGLESLVLEHFGANPLGGDAFVFISGSGKLLKCLFWDRTGFAIVAKKLERGKFELRASGVKLELDQQRLNLLLDGIRVAGTNFSE